MNEYRLVMAGLVTLVGLAPLTIVWPALDGIVCVLLLAGVLALVAGYWLREARRELRFRREMRALDAQQARGAVAAGGRR